MNGGEFRWETVNESRRYRLKRWFQRVILRRRPRIIAPAPEAASLPFTLWVGPPVEDEENR